MNFIENFNFISIKNNEFSKKINFLSIKLIIIWVLNVFYVTFMTKLIFFKKKFSETSLTSLKSHF
jgi:hypothetical protein